MSIYRTIGPLVNEFPSHVFIEKLAKLYVDYHEMHTLSVLLYNNVLLFYFHRYTAACSKILVQYKVAFKQVQKDFPTVEAFMKTYRVSIGIINGMILIHCIFMQVAG